MTAGVVQDDGTVKCGCGKKVGTISPDGVGFWCHACRAPVEVRFNEMKLNGLVQAMAALNSIAVGQAALTTSMTTVAAMIAQIQATGTPSAA